MKINWKVRVLNKAFWSAMIPAVLLLLQALLNIFGVEIDFGEWGNKLLVLVDCVFVILTLLGIVTDPTTAGFDDSERAMNYKEPN